MRCREATVHCSGPANTNTLPRHHPSLMKTHSTGASLDPGPPYLRSCHPALPHGKHPEPRHPLARQTSVAAGAIVGVVRLSPSPPEHYRELATLMLGTSEMGVMSGGGRPVARYRPGDLPLSTDRRNSINLSRSEYSFIRTH